MPEIIQTTFFRQKTIPSLDGIRAIAVLIVVLSHSKLGTVVPGGLGVTIFFFLSGYLITALMIVEREQTGSLDISGFYARRIFRLMPPLLVTLAIAYSLVAIGVLPGAISLKGFTAQLLYFANYYSVFFNGDGTIPAGTGILWSLAVEEHFYIFYPLVMAGLFRSNLRLKTIGIGLAIACAAVLVWRIELVQNGSSEPRTYYASDTRIDSIIYGALLAIWFTPFSPATPRRMSPHQWMLLLFGLGLMLFTLIYRNSSVPTLNAAITISH